MAQEPTLYEAMYILDSELSEEEIEEAINNIHSYVENNAGEVVSDELFGRRRLGYEIDHHTEGIYRIMYFHGEAATIQELRHEFGLMESVIRGMVVTATPEAMFVPEPVAEPAQPAAAAEELAAVEPEPEEAAPAEPVEEVAAVEPEPEEAAPAEPVEEVEADEEDLASAEAEISQVPETVEDETSEQQPETTG